MKNLLRRNDSEKVMSPQKPKSKFRLKKKTMAIIGGSILGVVLVIAILGYFFVFKPVTTIRAKGMEVVEVAKLLNQDIKANDIDLVQSRVKELTKTYESFENEAKIVYWATFVPYVQDFKDGVEAGRYMIAAADESVTAIYPYADLIGFKQGDQNFFDKSAEERLQTAVLTLDKMLEKIDVVADNIEQAEIRIAKIDPNRYPERIGDQELRSKIVSAKDQFEGMASLFVDAKPLLKELPQILGAEEEKEYLVLFQNTAERRATGGFYTFYAVFNINKGKITIKDSSDIYDLDDSISNHPTAPQEILDYHKNVSRFYIRDSNISQILSNPSVILMNFIKTRVEK